VDPVTKVNIDKSKMKQETKEDKDGSDEEWEGEKRTKSCPQFDERFATSFL